jgi:hypothetical protein
VAGQGRDPFLFCWRFFIFFFLELFIFLRQSQQSQKKDMTWIADSLPRGFGLRMDIGLVDCATTTSGLQSVDFFLGGGGF